MTPTASPALPDLPALDPTPDIRLIAVDMDGTLLDAEDRIHPTLWPLLAELDRRGIVFCPASGRQYANLAARFEGVGDDVVFIAENGAYVSRGGEEVSSAVVEDGVVGRVVETVRALAASGADVGVVVCGKRSAYIERHDAPFVAECDTYYAELERVDDLLLVHDDVLKIAVFDFGSAEATTAPALAPFRATHQVVVSGAHWVDVMDATTDKGAALRQVQAALGVTRAQTMAFGDYLNDLELLDAAEYSFAMAEAHPAVIERARYLAPSNQANGVVRTIAAVLAIPWSGLEAGVRAG
ncbi:MAG: Cof-type HAD-IIB family hydrolase [Cellulomonas sp.]